MDVHNWGYPTLASWPLAASGPYSPPVITACAGSLCAQWAEDSPLEVIHPFNRPVTVVDKPL